MLNISLIETRMQHDFSSSLITSVITAGIALVPDEALTYLGKLVSVLILAMIAEAGRRLIGVIWKQK